MATSPPTPPTPPAPPAPTSSPHQAARRGWSWRRSGAAALLSSAVAWLSALTCIALMALQPSTLTITLLTLVVLGIAVSQWLGRRGGASAATPSGRKADAGDLLSDSAATGDAEQLRQQLALAAEQLERRERAFAERLTTFQEWMEFPEPVQLAETPTTEQDVAAAQAATAKDRQLFALIDEETEALFNAIRDNKYKVEGKLDLSIARKDAVNLVLRVARIYQPDAEQPLLETSVSLILRSVSRASLQLLVVLEQLPVDLKEMNIRKLYQYVQAAVGYYGLYQRAKPYLPWASNAMYLGRYALGSSPLTLGAWYATGRLGAGLARAATQQIVNQQALQLVQNVVRLTAFEAAQTYSGDFRQRDPNWIYAAELTRLVATLPSAAQSLSLALAEVAALQLRSEYDRVWFYRCLASRQPASQSKRPALGLTPHERLQIASRLERFIASLPSGVSDAVARWRTNAEDRLGIKLGSVTYVGGEAAAEQALRSLGGFLLEVKQRPQNDWFDDLQQTGTIKLASAELRERLRCEPPYMFEYPDLAPDSEVAESFLADLFRLGAALPGRGADVAGLIEEIAAYLHLDVKSFGDRWAAALLDELRVRGPALRGEPPARCAARLLDHLDAPLPASPTPADAVYWPASLVGQPSQDRPGLAVLACAGELTAWDGESPQPTWRGGYQAVQLEQRRSLLGSDCLLRCGGLPTLVIEGAAWTRFERHFGPLIDALS